MTTQTHHPNCNERDREHPGTCYRYCGHPTCRRHVRLDAALAYCNQHAYLARSE